MASSLIVEPYATPGMVQVTAAPDSADGTGTWTVVRVDAGGDVSPMRSAPTIVADAVTSFVDVEASFHPSEYRLLLDGVVKASATITLAPLPSGRAVVRSVLRLGESMEFTVVDEVDIEYATSSAVHRIIGSSDPIVIADKRQRRSGTYVLATLTFDEAQDALRILKDGVPLLMRSCPNPAHPVRDGYFYALDVREAHLGGRNSAVRLWDVTYQTVSSVTGELALPVPTSPWTYADLQATALSNAEVNAGRDDYFDLYLNPLP